MAEVYVIGQILKAVDFQEPHIFCKWSLQSGTSWHLIQGEAVGQTFVATNRLESCSDFCQPLDLHLSTTSVQGWPKLHVEIHAVNVLNKSWPVGYGFVHIPTRPGFHRLEIFCWKIAPRSWYDSIREKFGGGGLALCKEDLIYTGLERFKLKTRSSGKIVIDINLIFRHFGKFGIEYKLFFLVYRLLMLSILSNQAVKIGISKPLPLTTTLPPSSTMETISEETNTEDISTDTSLTTVATKTTTTTKATTSESEWPEFPPKKTSNIFNKTTTEKPLTTTTSEPSTTININPNDLNNNRSITDKTEAPVTSFPKWPTKQTYCFCDLTKDFCDINCCCDHECSAVALKVFRCLSETDINLEIPERRFQNFKFQHGLPSCEVNDGWLCVFRTYKPLVKNEASYYLKDSSRYYTWPNLLMESEDIKRREFYKFGDVLRVINIETKEIQNFDLPSSFQSSSCRIQEPLYHLKPFKRDCLVSSYKDLKQAQQKLLQLEEKYKIFKTPTMPDDIYNNKHLESYTGNITIYKCLGNKQNCTHYKDDIENGKDFELFKVKVNILHNFTNIHEVVVDLWLKDLKEDKYLKSPKLEYWLSYETEFFNKTLKEFSTSKNTANQHLPVVSGPLGYLTGKPLIIARYEPFNKSQPLSTKNQIINYFSLNDTESHKLSLLAKENGKCKRSKYVEEHISYGINVAKYCKIKLDNDTLLKEEPSNTNFTEVCFNLQLRIHDELFGEDLDIKDLSSYVISQLGKPQNISNKWLQLQVYNTNFDSVVGQYLQETNTFVCRNILLSLAYEFHMANVLVDKVPLQNVINYAVLHLAERHDLEFSLTEDLEVPVAMTVRFFDVHEKAVSAGDSFEKVYLIFYIILVSILYF